MANLCEHLISKDINFDCEDLVYRGLEPDGLIINRSDIDFSRTTFNETNKNIIEGLVLKTGKKAYEVVQMGSTPFSGTTSELQVGTYRNTWNHSVAIFIPANTPEVCADIIDPLSHATFVLILRNKTKGADGSAEYQIYGYNQGCTASEGTNERYSEDTDGGWLMTMTENNSPKSGMFLFKTDAETTAGLYEALKSAAE